MASVNWKQVIKGLHKKDVLRPFSIQKIFRTISKLLPSIHSITFLDLNAKFHAVIFAGEMCYEDWNFYGISTTEARLPLDRSRGNVKEVDLMKVGFIDLSVHCIFNYWTKSVNPQEVIQSVRLAVLMNVELLVIPNVRILKELVKLCCVATIKVANFDNSRSTMCFLQIKDKLCETQRLFVLTWCNQFLTDHQERTLTLVF